MLRHPRTPSQRPFQVVVLYLIYSFMLSLCVTPGYRNAQASPRTGKEVPGYEGNQNPVPSPSPEPSTSPTPDPSTSPIPEPMPTMTPTTAPSPSQAVPPTALPNLDGLRYEQPEEPEVPDEVPSTRCSPGQPDCDPTTGSPVPPSQAFRTRRSVPARRQLSLLHDQVLAWIDNQFSTPFLKYDASRETSDMSLGSSGFFSLVEPQTGGSYDDFVMARLDPDNRVGTGGEDILSRNFNWNLPLVGMAGRSGLNLGLSLSYNSLVWTRTGNYITYDADNGYPTPGFRLGFPIVYGQHYNSQTGTYGYLMLMPSGGRVELRRVGSTNIYEAADSSYLQLTDNGNGTLLVRASDGTQLTYSSTTNGFRCTQIKDRNGNYITITNSSAGRLLTVTDTIARVFSFNYDTSNNLTSISQRRGSSQYTWVTFGYGNLTLQTNFTGLTIIGTQNGTTLPVLTQVGLPDGTYFKFSYSSWGQVYKITDYAADSLIQYDTHPLNYVSYNLPLTSSTAQTDCPRFTQRKEWAENWNNSAEAISNYAVPSTQTWTMPGGGQQTGTFCQIQTPDGVYQNVYLFSSGWAEGLPVLVNTYDSQIALQRQATTSYSQDHTGVSYPLNPRVTETNIYDPSGNHKRIAITYSTSFRLPTEIKEYAADATTVLRTTQTDYNLSSDYTNRRIIGLPSQKRVYDTTNGNALVSKVDFTYDDSGEFLVQQGSPMQHDTTNYGSTFVYRGNLTKVKTWDVVNTSESVESKTGYNTTGSPIFMRDPMNHQATISYTDNFADIGNANTFAYPTMATDPAGNQATSQYSFNAGVVTETSGPPPAGQTQGAIVTHAYDSIGRLYQTTNAVNGAYTNFIYPTSSNVIQSYTTIQDGLPATVSAKLLDGAGRVRATASEHPGSIGGYVGQYFVFDAMGRQIQQTNPTEIYGSWQPAGDDAAGWKWSVQTYDWKGRPRVTTNQDGSTREVVYGGCGCAGGEVVTVRDEIGRRERVISDVLGRRWKTQVLGWDGITVYSTITNTYNGRDQITRTLEQVGENGAGQETLVTYDGHGRLATRHVPVQATGTATSYSYNPDDTISTITDARGVVTTYSYNNRRLTTDISYNAPEGITPTPAISFTYDAVGNRTQMTDGTGSVTYAYDRLSRLTSETRSVTGVSSPYTLNYTYNLAGQVAGLSKPGSNSPNISYLYNQAGKLTEVRGNGYGGITEPYVTNTKYRAWGALKSYRFTRNAITTTHTNNYDTRMRITRYEDSDNWGNFNGQEYSYNADGRVSYARDLFDPVFDRSYEYDHAGRLWQAKSGAEARGLSTPDGPYKQNYSYDSFNNLTSRTGRHWTRTVPSFTATYQNDRNTNPQWQFDQAGNVTQDSNGQTTRQFSFDAAGHQVQTYEPAHDQQPAMTLQHSYDGNGWRVKSEMVGTSEATFEIRSSALGGIVVTKVSSSGALNAAVNVYAWGELIATQGLNQVLRAQKSPLGTSEFEGVSVGERKVELDPLHSSVGMENPYQGGGGGGGGGGWGGGGYPSYGDGGDYMRCAVDGDLRPCEMVIGRHYFDFLSLIVRSYFRGNLPVTESTTIEPEAAPEAPTIYGNAIAGTGDSEVYINAATPLTINTISYITLRVDMPTVSYLGDVRTEKLESAPIEVYTKYGSELTKCINKIFGKDANRLEYQQLSNAPQVDRSLTGQELGEDTPGGGKGEVDAGLTFPSDLERGRHGTVRIASDLWRYRGGLSLREALNRTYVHELGNLLAFRLTKPRFDARRYGDPQGIVPPTSQDGARDRDSGARLEKCVFKDK